jgi:hypothetical protein
MDIKELENWLKTPEGEAWGEQFKSPLLHKRDELLAALKESNAKLAELEQRSNAAAEELSQERDALSTLAVDKELSRMLRERHVMETAINAAIAELKDSYGIIVKANGLERKAVGKIKAEDGAEQEASLAEVISAWKKTPAAEQITLSYNSGGGATGSKGGMVTTPTLNNLSGPALAKLSDDQFHAMRQSAITAQGE